MTKTIFRSLVTVRWRLLGFVLALVSSANLRAQEARSEIDVSRVFPAVGAKNIPPDAPLRIRLGAAPQLGERGLIRIVDAEQQQVVETIDVSAPVAAKTIGGLDGFNYHAVLIAGDSAIVTPKPGALQYGRKYYVTIDAGAFRVGTAETAAVAEARWEFATKTAAPPAGSRTLTVAADGTGDFCSVQGALDFIPDGNTTPTTIRLRNGTYHEIVFFTDKHAITLLGEDRKRTIIAYPNNARFNPSGGNPFGGRTPNPSGEPTRGGNIYRRGMFMAHRVNDLTLANLTMHNTTPQGGSQAEALILNGTTSARAVIRDVDFRSFQDTVQINGQAFVSNCDIEGDVDFMWGTGPCFFTRCTARSLRSNAYYTQVRNPGTNHGYVYVDCTFEGAPGVTGNFLSRVQPARFPHSEVVLIDCVLTESVNPAGWKLDPSPAGAPIPPLPDLHFWEFNSRDPQGRPVDVSARMPGSRQLRLPEDAELVAKYRDRGFVLGGWKPSP